MLCTMLQLFCCAVAQVVAPIPANAGDDSPDDNSLLGFLSDGASMLVRSSLLQVRKRLPSTSRCQFLVFDIEFLAW